MFQRKTFVKKRFSYVKITERKNVIQNNIKITSYKRLKNVLCLLGLVLKGEKWKTAVVGVEHGTSRTQSENHITRLADLLH